MKKIEISTLGSKRVKRFSVKTRNATLRIITTTLEHKPPLDEKLMVHTLILFGDVKNFEHCEKCFYEAMIAMHFSDNEILKNLAETFQTLINTRKR